MSYSESKNLSSQAVVQAQKAVNSVQMQRVNAPGADLEYKKAMALAVGQLAAAVGVIADSLDSERSED